MFNDENWERWSKDCVLFVEEYLKIKLRPYNKDMLKKIQEHRLFLVNSERRSGKSSMLVYFSIWYAIFHSNKNILLFSPSDLISKDKSNIFSDVYPDSLKGIIKKEKNLVEFDNGSRIVFGSSSSFFTSGHGRQIDLLEFDEPDSMEGLKHFWDGVYPAISRSKEGKVIMVGTTLGGLAKNDVFYNLYRSSLDTTSNVHSMCINWWDVDDEG